MARDAGEDAEATEEGEEEGEDVGQLVLGVRRADRVTTVTLFSS